MSALLLEGGGVRLGALGMGQDAAPEAAVGEGGVTSG